MVSSYIEWKTLFGKIFYILASYLFKYSCLWYVSYNIVVASYVSWQLFAIAIRIRLSSEIDEFNSYVFSIDFFLQSLLLKIRGSISTSATFMSKCYYCTTNSFVEKLEPDYLTVS